MTQAADLKPVHCFLFFLLPGESKALSLAAKPHSIMITVHECIFTGSRWMERSTEACNKLSLRTTVSTRSLVFGSGWRVYSLLNWNRECVAMATVSRRGTECKQGVEPDHGTYFIRRQRKKDATCKRQTQLQFIVSGLCSTRCNETQRSRQRIWDVRDLRLPSRRSWELRSSRLSRNE